MSKDWRQGLETTRTANLVRVINLSEKLTAMNYCPNLLSEAHRNRQTSSRVWSNVAGH